MEGEGIDPSSGAAKGGTPGSSVTPAKLYVAEHIWTILSWIGGLAAIVITGAIALVGIQLAGMDARIEKRVDEKRFEELESEIKDDVNKWVANDLVRSLCGAFPDGAYDDGMNVCTVRTKPFTIRKVFDE